jgi:hypothetical protein
VTRRRGSIAVATSADACFAQGRVAVRARHADDVRDAEFIDLLEAFRDTADAARLADFIHPSAVGHDKIAGPLCDRIALTSSRSLTIHGVPSLDSGLSGECRLPGGELQREGGRARRAGSAPDAVV